MLLAGLLFFILLCSSDLLQVVAASQDVLAARAASSGSAVKFLGLVAMGQGLQQLLLLLCQVVIAASVHMRFEARSFTVGSMSLYESLHRHRGKRPYTGRRQAT